MNKVKPTITTTRKVPCHVQLITNRFRTHSLRLTLFSLSILLLALTFSACQTSEAIPENRQTAVKLRVLRRESVFQPINTNPETRANFQKAKGIDLQIEAVPSSNYLSKIKLSLASENLPDIIELSYAEMLQNIGSGRFEPLNDLIKTQAPHFSQLLVSHPELASLKIEGEFYAFPVLIWKSLPTAAVPILRQDALQSLALITDPTAKAPSSYEELLDLLVQIKSANPDQDLWINRNGTRNLISNIAFPLGSGYSQTTSFYFEPNAGQGKFLYGPAHLEFNKVLDFLSRAYASGVLDPYYALTTVDEWQQKLSTGQALFFFDLPINLENFNVPLRQRDPAMTFIPLLNLENTFGESRISFQYENHWLHTYYAISSKSKNIETAVRFMDWLYSDEGASVANYGLPGTDYTLFKDTAVIHPAHSSKYSSEPFSFRLMQYERGTGQGFFTPYVDQTFQFQIQPKLEEVMTQILDSGMGQRSPLPPPLTLEEAQRVSELTRQLDELLFSELDAYIIGEKPIEQYESVLMPRLLDAGALELEKILNHAWVRFRYNGSGK